MFWTWSVFAGLLAFKYFIMPLFMGSKSHKSSLPFPPGPVGFPVFGAGPIISMYGTLTKCLTSFKSKYGKIFSCMVGPHRIVVIADHELLKETLRNNNFQGRPDVPSLRVRGGGHFLGITENQGKGWDEQRNFAMRTLKEFGFEKNSMEAYVMDDLQEVVQHFRDHANTPVDVQYIFDMALHNTLLKMLTGKKIHLDDPALAKVHYVLCRGDKILFSNKMAAPYNVLPGLTKYFPGLTGLQEVIDSYKATHKFIDELIQEHKDTRQVDAPRDFIDVYLNRIDETTDSTSTFYKENGIRNLKASLVDLFGGASGSGSTTLAFAFLYLVHHPEVKRKVQEEIDLVIGRNRLPSFEDKPHMPYTEATVTEIFRKNSTLHLGIPRAVTQDTEFNGYFIPKGAILFPWFYGIHNDRGHWGEDVHKFKPERFIDANGKFSRDESVIPFGVGKRICPGEMLARMETWLYFVTVLQSFDMTFDPNSPIPTMEPTECCILFPPDYKLILTPRGEQSKN